jgi:hypothetical protein
VRVAPKHMAGARRPSRERGKSDSIDAFSVARAALREGIENLLGAHLDGAALDISPAGCGPLTAAKLIGEIAAADRFATLDAMKERAS